MLTALGALRLQLGNVRSPSNPALLLPILLSLSHSPTVSTHTHSASDMFALVKLSLVALALSSYKSLPMAYFFRMSWVFGKNIFLAKYIPQLRYSAKSAFESKDYHSYNSIGECDMYFHKNNATYFEDLDVARADLMTTLFQKFFLEYKTESRDFPFVPVGNIFGSFKRDIKPFARYTIKTSVLAWDNKWLFVMSKFITGKDKVASTMVTKYVLKDGRKTIKPEVALKYQGLWSEEVERQNQENLKLCQWMVNTDQLDAYEN